MCKRRFSFYAGTPFQTPHRPRRRLLSRRCRVSASAASLPAREGATAINVDLIKPSSDETVEGTLGSICSHLDQRQSIGSHEMQVEVKKPNAGFTNPFWRQ